MLRVFANLIAVFSATCALAQTPEVLLPGDKAPEFQVGKTIAGPPAGPLQRGKNTLLYVWSQADFATLEYDADALRELATTNPDLRVLVVNSDSHEYQLREFDQMAKDLFRGAKGVSLAQDTASRVVFQNWYKASLADSNIAFFINKHGYIGAVGDIEFVQVAFELFLEDNLDMAKARKVRADDIKARYAANAPLRQANSIIKANIGNPEAAFSQILSLAGSEDLDTDQFLTLWDMLLAIAKWSVANSGDPRRGLAFAQQIKEGTDEDVYSGLSDWRAFEAYCHMYSSPSQALEALKPEEDGSPDGPFLDFFLVLIDFDGGAGMRGLAPAEADSFAKTFTAIFGQSKSDLIRLDCLERTIELGRWTECRQMAAALNGNDLLSDREQEATIQAIDAARSFEKPFTLILDGETQAFETGAEALASMVANMEGSMVSSIFEFAAAKSLRDSYGKDDFETILSTTSDLYMISPGEAPFLTLADATVLSDEDMRTFFIYFTETIDLLPNTAVRIIRQYDGKPAKKQLVADLVDSIASSEDYRAIYLEGNAEFIEESLAMADLLIRAGKKGLAEQILNKCRQTLFESAPNLSTTPTDVYYPYYLYYLSLVARAG